ncbi:MAG: hypothetical protein ACXIVQ_11440 [Acidimicrobiales bacterium]
MFDPGSVELIESGCALIVGSVEPDGTPHASRGWGARVMPGSPPRVRLLIDAHDVVLLANIGGDGAGELAVTAADVRSLRSVQMKGTVVAVEPADDADRDRAARYIDQLFTDIEQADGADRSVLARWVPSGYAACVLEVTQQFDQTPGPGAGAPLAGGAG